jgi:hypothetical protein
MDTVKNSGRKNFKCIFNDYITAENRDAVIQSIISQFQGYFAEPEVTLLDHGFVLSLSLSDDLTDHAVRDKILWNRYIERVTTQDAIRKIQILRLPQAGLMDFGGRIEGNGSVGGFGPDVDPIVGDTGVNEKLNIPQDHPAKYKIDGGKDPKTLGETASVHLADKTDMSSEGQAFVKGLTPESLSSDATELVAGPNDELSTGKRVMGFRVLSFESDTGGSFTMTHPNQYGIDMNDTHQLKRTNQDLAMLPKGNFYNTDINNERGTRTGVETESRGDEASSAPLIFNSSKTNEPEVEDEESATAIPQARGGGQSVPDGGKIEGWYASNFGLNETYDYAGDKDDYEF